MKNMKKFVSCLCASVLLFSVCTMGASAASSATTKFLDPFDESSYQQVNGHWTFIKAHKYNVILPDNYDVDLAKIDGNGGVFGFNPNKPALAAFKRPKTMELFNEIYGSYNRNNNLMKNYVATRTEMIYYFENGFKDFEFMGIASSDSGTGTWAGSFGMEENPPVEFFYSDSADGGWKQMDYSALRTMPQGETSDYCYFGNSDKNKNKNRPTIPTSARYLKVHFKNGSTWNAATSKWDANYANWQCVLGYLLVNKYNEPQGNTSVGGGTSSTSSKPGGTTGTGSKVPTASTGSQTENVSSVSGDGTESNTSQEQNGKDDQSTTANGKDDYYEVITREMDWKIVGIIIAVDVLVIAGVVSVLIVLYRKKLKELGVVSGK